MNQGMDYVDADNLTPEHLREQLEAISAKIEKHDFADSGWHKLHIWHRCNSYDENDDCCKSDCNK
jgi:hypothetical protein